MAEHGDIALVRYCKFDVANRMPSPFYIVRDMACVGMPQHALHGYDQQRTSLMNAEEITTSLDSTVPIANAPLLHRSPKALAPPLLLEHDVEVNHDHQPLTGQVNKVLALMPDELVMDSGSPDDNRSRSSTPQNTMLQSSSKLRQSPLQWFIPLPIPPLAKG